MAVTKKTKSPDYRFPRRLSSGTRRLSRPPANPFRASATSARVTRNEMNQNDGSVASQEADPIVRMARTDYVDYSRIKVKKEVEDDDSVERAVQVAQEVTKVNDSLSTTSELTSDSVKKPRAKEHALPDTKPSTREPSEPSNSDSSSSDDSDEVILTPSKKIAKLDDRREEAKSRSSVPKSAPQNSFKSPIWKLKPLPNRAIGIGKLKRATSHDGKSPSSNSSTSSSDYFSASENLPEAANSNATAAVTATSGASAMVAAGANTTATGTASANANAAVHEVSQGLPPDTNIVQSFDRAFIIGARTGRSLEYAGHPTVSSDNKRFEILLKGLELGTGFKFPKYGHDYHGYMAQHRDILPKSLKFFRGVLYSLRLLNTCPEGTRLNIHYLPELASRIYIDDMPSSQDHPFSYAVRKWNSGYTLIIDAFTPGPGEDQTFWDAYQTQLFSSEYDVLLKWG